MSEQRIDEQFLILHGKVGNWPGDVTLPCAEAIFRTSKTFSANSVFLDIQPGPGRSTIFLATAAQAIGAKIFTVGAFSSQPDMFWYNRAIRLFGLQDIVQHRNEHYAVESRDFIVVRQDQDLPIMYDSLNPRGAMLVIGDSQSFGNGKPQEVGAGFTLWRK